MQSTKTRRLRKEHNPHKKTMRNTLDIHYPSMTQKFRNASHSANTTHTKHYYTPKALQQHNGDSNAKKSKPPLRHIYN